MLFSRALSLYPSRFAQQLTSSSRKSPHLAAKPSTVVTPSNPKRERLRRRGQLVATRATAVSVTCTHHVRLSVSSKGQALAMATISASDNLAFPHTSKRLNPLRFEAMALYVVDPS